MAINTYTILFCGHPTRVYSRRQSLFILTRNKLLRSGYLRLSDLGIIPNLINSPNLGFSASVSKTASISLNSGSVLFRDWKNAPNSGVPLTGIFMTLFGCGVHINDYERSNQHIFTAHSPTRKKMKTATCLKWHATKKALAEVKDTTAS